MAIKDETKKAAGKASKTGQALKTKAARAKAPTKTEKKGTAKKKPGRTRAKTEMMFRLEAPQATQVFVVGCFNEWDPVANPLERDGEGVWSCTLEVEPGEHEYRFVVDGAWWDDPANTLRRCNEFGTQNCLIIVED